MDASYDAEHSCKGGGGTIGRGMERRQREGEKGELVGGLVRKREREGVREEEREIV